jgi:pimeloyl-ACP methyl ester carboxylesterase
MPTFHEHHFHTGTLAINYAEGPPSGPPFVLLHGGSAGWLYGEPFMQAMADHWRVYAPDLRGHGKSDHLPGHYLLTDYVGDITLFLQGVVREPAVLYGHSLGGEIGVMLAARSPQLLRALIVGDAPLDKGDHSTERNLHRAQNELWRDLAASGKSVDEIAEALKDMLVPVPGENQPKRAGEVFGEDSRWFRFQAQNLSMLDPTMLDAVLAGPEFMLAEYEAEKLLPQITCPVLILQADPALSDALTDQAIGQALALLPRGTHVRLEGIGHELHGPAQQTPRIVEAITPFLERIESV